MDTLQYSSERQVPASSESQFLHFLAFFSCDRIPKALFAGTKLASPQWSNDGELKAPLSDPYELEALDFGQHSLQNIIEKAEKDGILRTEGAPCFQWYIVNEVWKEQIACNLASDKIKDIHFKILGIVLRMFPEAWSVLLWEAIEEQLWEVIESTCVPFLGILDKEDLREYLSGATKRQKCQYLKLLLRFLTRLLFLLKPNTRPSLFELISESITLLKRFKGLSQSYLEYLELTTSIAEIINRDKIQPGNLQLELRCLTHNGSKRSNAAIGFALGILPSTRMTASGISNHDTVDWVPLSNTAPSTMETLALSSIAGVSSLRSKVPERAWDKLSLESKVLIAFTEVKNKNYENGYQILHGSIKGLMALYGPRSMEFLLAGTTLINCCNITRGREEGVELGNFILLNFYESEGLALHQIGCPQETYLLLAVADASLAQSDYLAAESLLQQVLDYPLTDSNVALSAALRLLKSNRRQGGGPLSTYRWEQLRCAITGFGQAPDSIKYECLEEAICFLSALDSTDIVRTQQAVDIVKVLSKYRENEYGGLLIEKLNFLENLESLKEYRNKFNIFSLSGPQLYYCKKLWDRFPHATVQFIETVGAANWQRFQRIKEMREKVQNAEESGEQLPIHTSSESIFHDSGLGSSLGFESKQSDTPATQVRRVARSVTSIRSFMSYEEGAIKLPPIPARNFLGERTCIVCKRVLKDISNESQWKRHAFLDLRPYVCIVEGCNVSPIQFESRAEYAAHLAEHQYIKVWTCTVCGDQSHDRHLLEQHLVHSHQLHGKGKRNEQIRENNVLRDLLSQKCPFCDKIPGGASFVGHICHHLEEISYSGIEQEDDISEGESKKRLTTYAAHTIRKVQPRDCKREKTTWAKAEITKESITPEEICRQVKRLNDSKRSISVSDKKQALQPFQQGQITRLLDNLNNEDDLNFQWSLVQIDQKIKPLKNGPGRETTSITCYVKRTPVPGIDPLGLYNALEQQKAARIANLNKPLL